MEGVKKIFADKGLQPSDIPKGLVVHEVLGLGVLVTAWAGCYLLRPSARLMAVLRRGKEPLWAQAQARMGKSKVVKLLSQSRFISPEKVGSIGVAFGESYFLRKLLMPVLVPLKIWLSLKVVLALK